jgi:hypothetical protein
LATIKTPFQRQLKFPPNDNYFSLSATIKIPFAEYVILTSFNQGVRMISKCQYRRLYKMINQGTTLNDAAAVAGIDIKTARKYLMDDNPFQKADRNWKTRNGPFNAVWEEIETMLALQPRLEAKTIFFYLLEKYPGQFQEGQLRTLQRRVKTWKALEGESKEVFFDQIHKPGELGSSDFTYMNSLKITIQGCPFPHFLYHFVLTYSNWESVTICFSENLESLSEGLQNALWQAGGAPNKHRTDRLTAAMSNFANQPKFGARYKAILDHYRIEGVKTQPSSPNENGDVEQSHYRIKKAVDQALMLRNSRDFSSIHEYKAFLKDLIIKRNAARSKRFAEEQQVLNALPLHRIQDATITLTRVGRGSTIRIKEITYSVPSRLIGEQVEVRLFGAHLEIWYQGHKVEEYSRLAGSHKAKIDYRHVIDWLVRKPGAFENYRYKDEMYPTSIFRAAYDILKENAPQRFIKEYLGILKAASQNGEARVEQVLKNLMNKEALSLEAVMEILAAPEKIVPITCVEVPAVDLHAYDLALLEGDNS